VRDELALSDALADSEADADPVLLSELEPLAVPLTDAEAA